MLSKKQIKDLLEERRKDKTNITATIDQKKVRKLKDLAKEHGVSFSAMLEVCIELGLADEYINPVKKEEDDFE